MSKKLRIGIIGGTGFESGFEFKKTEEVEVDTPFGSPSNKLLVGEIGGVEVVFLPRHGIGHVIMPSLINYRANLYALKKVGCTHIVATNACGSLQTNYEKGDLVTIDQIYDATKKRNYTLYDNSCPEFPGVKHVSMAEPFDKSLRDCLSKSMEELKFKHHKEGTIVVIEGPRFSTRHESRYYRSLGAHLIGMTSSPEAFIANELELPYAAVALVTDYDSWNEEHEPVTAEAVNIIFREFKSKLVVVIGKFIEKISKLAL